MAIRSGVNDHLYENAPEELSPREPLARWLFGGLAALVVFAVLLGLQLAGVSHARTRFDQDKFHMVAIAQFAAQLPLIDYRDYASATTPGFHTACAVLVKVLGAELAVLRAFNAAITAVLVGLLAVIVSRNRSWLSSAALVLPLVCCSYVVQAGLYVLPDNLAWLLVVVVLGLALHETRKPVPIGAWMFAALFVAVLVFVRQIHLWTAGAVWVAAWFGACSSGAGSSGARSSVARGARRGLVLLLPGDGFGAGVKRVALTALATLPAVLFLLFFVRLWGGLAPPSFQTGVSVTQAGDNEATNVVGLSLATPAFILSLLAIYSVFMIAYVWPAIAHRRAVWGWLAAGAIVGFVLAVLPPTTWQARPRVGGLWQVVKALDVRGVVMFGRTSPLIVVLSTVGGAFVAAWLCALPVRARWVMGAALVGFVCAMTAQALSWQRYFEPMLLVWVAIAASRAFAVGDVPAGAGLERVMGERARVIGPGLLGAMLLAVTVAAFVGLL